MSSQLLTIVVPTRDRLELLEFCLRSVFERQDTIPEVIVSDNSSIDVPGMELLRQRYQFSYVRQSGQLSMVDHHNACLKMTSTPWALLLHDDDELFPNVIGRLESFLAQCSDSGLVVGGMQRIDEQGAVQATWLPQPQGTFRGEDGVLRVGLDFRAAPPSTIWNTTAFHQAGGFPNARGAGADYTLVVQLSYSHGVTFLPEIIGRYRIGAQQATDYSTPERAEAILDCSIEMAQLTRTTGISQEVADQLIDYMTWWIFRIIASRMINTYPFFVARLWRKCIRLTPASGRWKDQIRIEYPILFWRPQWLAMSALKVHRWVPLRLRRTLWNYVRSF
jgi:glycosyltransferase involved in cell wall biosynthesis